mmetsp:Transcript_28927/g.66928  ORF Transcript_28927/g.66928 Transcript_28927/m.66928 type:complete len:415 (+) Transcript_28927:260-1504(+)
MEALELEGRLFRGRGEGEVELRNLRSRHKTGVLNVHCDDSDGRAGGRGDRRESANVGVGEVGVRQSMAKTEQRLDFVLSIPPVTDKELLRVGGVGRVVDGKARVLRVAHLHLVLLVGHGDGQTRTGVHVTVEDVRDGVAGLLPRHKGHHDRLDLVSPGHQDSAGGVDNDDSVGVGGDNCLDQCVLSHWKGQVDTVSALAGRRGREHNSDVGSLGGGHSSRDVCADVGGGRTDGSRTCLDALETGDDVRRKHHARPTTAHNGRVLGGRSKNGKRLGCERENPAFVLEQHRRPGGQSPAQVVVALGCDVGVQVAAGRVVEQANLKHGPQDALHLVIDHRHGHGAVVHGLRQVGAKELVRRHLLVESGKRREHSRVRRTPVGHDPALEAEALLEVDIERLVILAAVHMVDLVVAAHD